MLPRFRPINLTKYVLILSSISIVLSLAIYFFYIRPSHIRKTCLNSASQASELFLLDFTIGLDLLDSWKAKNEFIDKEYIKCLHGFGLSK